jgi:hypothetical protein
MARNEDLWLEEWVTHHVSIGFEHIYIYDNQSRIPVATQLAEYVNEGLITVEIQPEIYNKQRIAYRRCLEKYGNDSKWMAFIDVDEFIVPKRHDDIRDLLDEYLPFGALGIHWRVFGSSHHTERPAGGVIDNYTQVISFDPHIKAVVQPEHVSDVNTVHNFKYRNGYFCVNEDRFPVATHWSYHVSNIVQLNHYYYKSFEDFKAKIHRGRGGGGHRPLEESFADFRRQASAPVQEDLALRDLRDAKRACGLDSPAALKAHVADHALGEQAFIEGIVQAQETGDARGAADLLRRALRCHDSPEMLFVAARTALWLGDDDRFRSCVSRLLVDVDCPRRGDAYGLLASRYGAMGDAATAERLTRVLAE